MSGFGRIKYDEACFGHVPLFKIIHNQEMTREIITHSFLSFRKALVKIVTEIVNDPVEVEDILQETYIKSFEINKKKTIKSPKAYMARTARNLALNHIARSSFKFNISTEVNDAPPVYSNAPSVEEQVESEKRFKLYCDAIQSLPVNCRRVFVLKQVYGLSQKEIAHRLSISEKTVEYHLGKGLYKCKKYLEAVSSPTASVVELRHNKTVL